MATEVHLSWTLDCEATQRAIDNVELGRRAVRGFVDLVRGAGMRATLFVLPKDAQGYPQLLRELATEGVEVGLHYHPHEEGHSDPCGAYAAEQQRAMYMLASRHFADALEFEPKTFRTGSCSANDATFSVTAELGFTSCSHSMPGRNMTALCSNWAGAPEHVHYAHPSNRLLEGGLDLVEVPLTTDPNALNLSKGHVTDLRVEKLDDLSHRSLLNKTLARERTRSQPIRTIVALSHNVFDYTDPSEAKFQMLRKIMAAVVELADQHEITLRHATISDIAAAYRRATVEPTNALPTVESSWGHLS